MPGKATGEQAAEQANLNKADEKPTAQSKTNAEQTALGKADEKQPEEKAANAAAQNATAKGHHPQGAATQAQAAAEIPLQAPAAPQTGAQSTQGTEPHSTPEKATPAPENTRF